MRYTRRSLIWCARAGENPRRGALRHPSAGSGHLQTLAALPPIDAQAFRAFTCAAAIGNAFLTLDSFVRVVQEALRSKPPYHEVLDLCRNALMLVAGRRRPRVLGSLSFVFRTLFGFGPAVFT